MLAALLLGACAPAYNWREVRPTDPLVAVMLPGKPAALTQRILLDGRELVMSMSGAKVDENSFTVACAALPTDEVAVRESVLAAMRAGMLRNIGGTEERAEPMQVMMIDAAGATLARLNASRSLVKGKVQGRAMTMQAIFVATDKRACQAVALGPALPEEEARVFLDSLRLMATAGS